MTDTSSGFTEFMLGQLRVAGLRTRVLTSEIDSIGTALRGNFITADDAMEWMAEIGALGLITGAPSVTTLVST